MLSRALTLAAANLVGCLAGCFMATAVQAENLDAGKSPAQIFNSTCNVCHKSAKGLLKTVSPSSLPGFLRQHYTTGTEMAQMLSGFLISNGAGSGAAGPDVRVGSAKRGARPESGANLRPDAPIGTSTPDMAGQTGEKERDRGKDREKGLAERPERLPTRANVRPDADSAQGEGEPQGRKQRQPRMGVASHPDGVPAEGASADEQGGPKGRAHPELARRGRKGEPPKAALPESAPPDVASKPEPRLEAKPETKPDAAPERTIDAAVPVPEPVVLPPPTAADIKLDAPTKTEVTAKPPAPVPVAAPPASVAAAPAGPPAPPISQ